jgi:hypothetical protein
LDLPINFKSSGSQKPSALAKYLIEYEFDGGAQNLFYQDKETGKLYTIASS